MSTIEYTICDDCDEEFTKNDIIDDDGSKLCRDCFVSRGRVICEECNEIFDTADIVVEGYCADCATDKDYFECDGCNGWQHLDGSNHYDNSAYCGNCFTDLNLWFCEGCEDYFEEDDIASCGANYYCEPCANTKGFYKCESCNNWEQGTHGVCDDTYCSDCFYDRFFYCEDCGENYSNDDCISTDDGCYCPDCAPNDDEADFSPSFRKMHDRIEYNRVGSSRKFGVELECISFDGHTDLNRQAWGCKPDGSIPQGKEFYTAILNGNDGLKSVMALTDYAARNNWDVSNSCGYHLHINMKDEDSNGLKAIAYAYHLTQEVWESFVNSRRVGYSYCDKQCTSISDFQNLDSLDDWKRFSQHNCRNEWVNWVAYTSHGSLEIRLHEGTVDSQGVRNWIRAHTTFADWASKTGPDEVFNKLGGNDLFDLDGTRGLLAKIWDSAGCSDLIAFYGIQELVTA